MQTRYYERYNINGKIPASYEVLFLQQRQSKSNIARLFETTINGKPAVVRVRTPTCVLPNILGLIFI